VVKQTVEHLRRPAPAVRRVVRGTRRLRPFLGDHIPAEREADDVDAKAVEAGEALLEPRPGGEPRVVLDPEADEPRGLCGDGGHERDGGGCDGDERAHGAAP
jgi:hypothetical protein